MMLYIRQYFKFQMVALTAFLLVSCATTTPLQNAIIRDDIEKAEQLASIERETINAQDSKGKTALHYASIKAQVNVIRTLLEAGADPNIQDNDGSVPLIEAAYKCNPSIIELLLKHGAEVDYVAAKKNGWTPLLVAVNQNAYPVVKMLLDNGANTEIANNKGSTALLMAVKEDYTATAVLLLSHGANPNAMDHQKMTPLMHAVLIKNEYLVDSLIEKNASIESRSIDDKTALDLARENGLTEIANRIEQGNSAETLVDSEKKPMLILKGMATILDGEPLPDNSRRAWELRLATGHFLDLILETGLFSTVDTLDEENKVKDAVFVDLKVSEKEEKHTAGNATKAFLSGFLTLGLAPVSSDYGYTSEVTMILERPGGERKEYKASSDTSVDWIGYPGAKAYIKKARNSRQVARRVVIHQAFSSLISQLSDSLDSEVN